MVSSICKCERVQLITTFVGGLFPSSFSGLDQLLLY